MQPDVNDIVNKECGSTQGGHQIMAVNVRKLYKSVEDEEVELLAGAGGLVRAVRWVHIVENTEISTFLEGGEIVFTTGVALEKEGDLFETVKAIIANGASAIFINIGPYIREIGGEIIEFCEERQIPLFQVPWKVHMAEIMRRFCLMITLEDKKQLELSSAVKNAVLFPDQTELYVPHLENYGLHVNDAYHVMLIGVPQQKEEKHELYEKILLRQVENYISQMEWNCTVTEMESFLLLLFSGEKYTEEVLEQCVNFLVANCLQLRNQKQVVIGIGQPTKNMYCIARSFREAKSVIDLAKMDVQDTIFYSRLGLYKLLLGIADREVVRSYVWETIGTLLDYDKLNNNNLTDVLRVYLKHNGSVKEAAEEMFVHRNTINYKIHRIGELLNCSLTDYEVCARLNIALKLYDIRGTEIGHL